MTKLHLHLNRTYRFSLQRVFTLYVFVQNSKYLTIVENLICLYRLQMIILIDFTSENLSSYRNMFRESFAF